MESLEGEGGIPGIRPPFRAVVGQWVGMTVINNVETLAAVRHIIMGGAEWYSQLGTPKNGGTRLFCLAGNLNKPGVYELPMGYNLKKMIYDVGGGIPNGRSLKAVVPGGSSTPVLLPEEIDVPMDFDWAKFGLARPLKKLPAHHLRGAVPADIGVSTAHGYGE